MQGCWGVGVPRCRGTGVPGCGVLECWRTRVFACCLTGVAFHFTSGCTGNWPNASCGTAAHRAPGHQAQACSTHSASLPAADIPSHPQPTPSPHVEESGYKAAAWRTQSWSRSCRSRGNQRNASELQKWKVPSTSESPGTPSPSFFLWLWQNTRDQVIYREHRFI